MGYKSSYAVQFYVVSSARIRSKGLPRVKILIVINDYLNKSNGMCISTQRFVEEFRAAGHEVRIATNDRYGALDYPLGVVRIPVFSGIIEKEGFTFARADMRTIRKAVAWADVVHVEDPFLVCRLAAREARRAGKPVTGTFHLYPENMTYAVHLGEINPVNRGFLRSFVSGVYNRCLCVQCPTAQVRDRLAEVGATAKLEVISNGIAQAFIDAGKKRLEAGKVSPDQQAGLADSPSVLHVLSVGRFAPEKNQATLLEAIAQAKHGKQMHVTLAGKGPIEVELRKKAVDLGLDVDFGFFEQDELRDLMCANDVYVHCADVEVEGMSCMEAFACGCVPVISDASLSSTKAYALTGHNIFSHANAADLAAKLDWLYENRSDLVALSRQYIEYAQGLGVRGCAEKVLAMMGEARDQVARDQVGCMGQVPRGQAGHTGQAGRTGQMAHGQARHESQASHGQVGHADQAPRDQMGHADPAVVFEPVGPHSVAARLRVRISRGVHHRLGRGRKDGDNGRA